MPAVIPSDDRSCIPAASPYSAPGAKTPVKHGFQDDHVGEGKGARTQEGWLELGGGCGYANRHNTKGGLWGRVWFVVLTRQGDACQTGLHGTVKVWQNGINRTR